MKTLLLLVVTIFLSTSIFAQNQGISYQAVIIDQKPQEIPGTDIEGNIMPNQSLMVRFTILDAAGTLDYQEEHATQTDAFGIINLVIGRGTATLASPTIFTEIDWNGAPKDLKVDISLGSAEVFYTDFSYQELNFIPYAYHKNITATGTLKVDNKSTLQDLEVKATTNLLGSLDVNNSSPTHLSGNLLVDSTTLLRKTLTVNSTSSFNGQVTINANVNGDQTQTTSYPLVVKGSTQGISIKVDGSKSSANNFLLFSDEGGVQGRIEGESDEDVYTDPKYIFQNLAYGGQVIGSTIKLFGACTSSTVCVGLGACVTTPTPSLIITAAAKLVIDIAQVVSYNYFRFANAGVVYKTKGADYAEWLPKSNPTETFFPGEIIGVKGGFVTKSTSDADMIMVISSRPIVLGNMPDEKNINNYVMVAFIGQVPAKVLGDVQSGDYIIASGNNDGTGFAVATDKIKAEQVPLIAGMVWPNTDQLPLGYTNIAVGMNVSNAAKLAIKQEEKIEAQNSEINQLTNQISQMNAVLSQLIPGYTSLMDEQLPVSNQVSNLAATPQVQTLARSGETIVYADLTKEQIQEGIDLATRMLSEKGVDLSKDIFFTKIATEPGYKESFINEMQTSVQKELALDMEKNLKAGVNVMKVSN
jgi:hypothetical protein